MPLDNCTPREVEYLDVLDDNGRFLGSTRSIDAVHQRGDWHRTVHIWICSCQGHLLLQRRSLNKQASPGLWDVSCAGHISAGETSLAAAARECMEELGFQPPASSLQLLFEIKSSMTLPAGGTDREFNDVYLLNAEHDLNFYQPNPAEVIGLRLLHWRALETLCHNRDPEYVRHEEEYHRLFEHLNIQG